jgi:hypothetical protein
MSANKRLNTGYTLTTINDTDTVTFNTSQVTVTGNLVVLGSQTAIETTNTTIWDNIITLNGGLSPGIAPTLNAGIEVDRGTMANVTLRWNEGVKTWQIADQFGVYANIAYTYSGSGAASSLLSDPNPSVSANLNMWNYAIYSNTQPVVYFGDNVAVSTTSVAPSAITNNVVVYASTVSGGGSGLYTASTGGNNELATKSAAIKYSIIFG